MSNITPPTIICCFCNKTSKPQIPLDSCPHSLCPECFEIIQMIDMQNPVTQSKIICPKCKKPSLNTNYNKPSKNLLIDSNIIKDKIRLQRNIRNDISPYRCLENRNKKEPDIKTPEKSYIFGKRAFSQSIKTEKPKHMNENIEDLVKINNESSFESTNPFKSFRCKIHDDEISLFCLNEKETLCPSCVYHITEKHKKHRIIPLKCAYQIMSQENEKFRGVAKEKLQKIEDCIAFTMKNISILDRNLKNMTSGVEKEFLLLRNLIEKKEREIIGVINQLYLEKIQTYENKIKDLGFLHSCLNDYQFYEPNMKSEQKNNFVYVYNVNSILKKTLNNIDLNYKMLNISDLDKVSFPNKKKVFQEIENFVVIIQQNEAKNKSLMNISFKTNNSNSMKSKNNISYDGEKGNSFDFFGNQEILQQNNPNRSLNGFHKRSKTDLIHSHN